MKYTLVMHTGSLNDLSGKGIALFITSFTTDNTRPRITSVNLVNGAVNVATDKIIGIKFSEAVTSGTGWIELKNTNGIIVPTTKTIIGNCLYIKHTNPLAMRSNYSVIVHTNSIKDLSGNGVDSFYTNFLTATGLNQNHPLSTVKISFIHHSSGGNWLATGNLGAVLNSNNYYVTETDYGWGAESGDSLGDRTDTVNWPEWFTKEKMPYIYRNNYHSAYTNTINNPGGENEIIMFKSCFTNSEVGSSINDEKTIYNSLKSYFAAYPNKLFVLITPPGEAEVNSHRLTRDLCNWLVAKNGWLRGTLVKMCWSLIYTVYCLKPTPIIAIIIGR